MLKSELRSKLTMLNVLPYLVIAGMTVLFLFRSVFGFDWSDETYYLALPYRFLLGDRLFVDSWDIHQTSALLMVPLLWLYRMVTGGMDGIILFMRVLYILTHAVVTLFMYRVVLRFFQRRMPSLLCAALFFSFTPYGINTFSYNSMAYLFTAVSILFLFLLYSSPLDSRWALFVGLLSGVFFALSAISYPFFLMVGPLLAFALWWLRPIIKKGIRETVSRIPMAGFCGGACAVFTLVGIGTLAVSGFDGVFGNIKNLFQDPEHPYQSIFVQTSYFFQDYKLLVWLSLLELTLLVLILLSRWMKMGVDLTPVFDVMIWISLPLCLIINVGMVLIQSEAELPMTSKVNYLQACAGLWPLILTAQKPSRRSLIVILVLYLPSFVMSWAIYIASNNGVTGSSFILSLSVLALVLTAYDYLTATLSDPVEKQRVLKTLWGALATSLMLLVLCNTVMRAQAVYRDSPIVSLRVQLTSGPAQGLYTTSGAAAKYAGIVNDIRSAASQSGGRVMFNELLPFGYLCIENRPAPPSLWRNELPSDRIAGYFKQRPQNRPALLYVVKAPYGLNNGTKPVTQRTAERILGGKVVMRETEYSYQFTRKPEKPD